MIDAVGPSEWSILAQGSRPAAPNAAHSNPPAAHTTQLLS